VTQHVRIPSAPGRLRLRLETHGHEIGAATIAALRSALEPVCGPANSSVRLVSIECAGPAGAKETGSSSRDTDSVLQPLIMDLLRARTVTAAIVTGRCVGEAFEVVLACDVIVAAASATLGLMEAPTDRLPLIGQLLLPFKIGVERHDNTVLAGTPRSAREWEEIGLIQCIGRAETLPAEIDAWYAALEQHPAAALGHAAFDSRVGVRRAVESLVPAAEGIFLRDVQTSGSVPDSLAGFFERPTRAKES
jgi:enoyl-CoA hydratase/carnithine racemase